ncbi:hypothetical protein TNCV_3534741 [Trichonephila clavipes]|nr:hypothetical protein TNCV_3534741 [Trichonephila clavipes]
MEYRHPGSPSIKKFKTLMPASKIMLTIFLDASGIFYAEFLTKGLTMNSNRYCAALRSLKQRIRRIIPERNVFFASRHCKTVLQCTNTRRHGKTEIHSGSITILQPRFGTVGLLVVLKIEKKGEGSTVFNGCRSSSSCVQMDTQPTRIFPHGRNEKLHRMIEQMCSC